MSYNLDGRKYVFMINIINYDNQNKRHGADVDEQNIIDTFQEKMTYENCLFLTAQFSNFLSTGH